ncbi:hypothetical protein [Streptomyces sp. NPDC052114]
MIKTAEATLEDGTAKKPLCAYRLKQRATRGAAGRGAVGRVRWVPPGPAR